ncbi:PdaC/SigV domain-containing protein [Novosphingobium decolorationis]|uniref:DUF3298 and DUF4163 domain-containing protein n=1 Tax=Novosphingobium decolorationis TaxID=2698673 RepID=A0ABX8E5Y1_9SPHN|nr:DUF4163 domain-containing protein [Novosphingobium decolorationis]QVM84208.1 DUF3298 and DUF4163 domain-containing protein [Novosphingobium decolorationis]
MRAKLALGCAGALALMAGGCSGAAAPDAGGTASPPTASDTAAPSAPQDEASASAPEVDDPAVDVADLNLEEDTDSYEFQFSYPAKAAAIPELRSWFEARRSAARAELASASRRDREEAEKSGYPFHPHSFGANWQVVTDLPDWLSLSSEFYTFTGGAHGMSGFDARVWNRKTATLQRATDLFTSPEALSGALRTRFCKALDDKRIERRGGPLDPEGTFSECIDPVRQTVLLGSSNGATFDRIGFQIAPYEAGPYAEGSYEITLPVDGAVMRALKPQYRASFSIPD